MIKPLHKLITKTTFGQLSLALLIICVVSGIFLVVPYNVNDAYGSISFLMLTNPAASLFRNIHYWSAQFFLLFTVIHLYDHFTRKKAIKLNMALWFRLTLGVLIIFLAMITGFILKGDADAGQAQRIFSGLVTRIPLIGEMIRQTFLGDGESLQFIYVHHIATFTIFIIIVVMEHAPTIWPRLRDFVITMTSILILSVLLMAPLHDGLSMVVKGPWYFVGFQEILHLITHPGYSLIIVLLLLFLLFVVPLSRKKGWLPKRLLLFFTLVYLFLTVIGYFFRGANWQWQWPWKSNEISAVYNPVETADWQVLGLFSKTSDTLPEVILGRNESCLICHQGMTGFSKSHNPQAVGCYSCHGGNPFSRDKEASHQGMRLIPGNLADAGQSCGTTQCHQQITSRINNGLMANLSGMISVDRFVFNEIASPDELTTVDELHHSPADEHLKNMCVTCHLGSPKTETGPITNESRGGGCLACHLNYNEADSSLSQLAMDRKNHPDYLKIHPSIDLKVSNNHCFGCHNRSGRISTNYEGWHETLLNPDELATNHSYRIIDQTRVFTYIQEDVHHKLKMDCIDCHNSYELMGDDMRYAHQEQQVDIACADCHRTKADLTVTYAQLDQESALITGLRYSDISNRVFLTTEKRNKALINTEFRNDTMWMHGKNRDTVYVLRPPNAVCTYGKAHDEVSCNACHSAWAPSCIGCHNAYDENEPGYDMVKNVEKQGSWVEYVGEYNAGLPALGIRKTASGQEIIPVVPGMVLTIDLASYTKDKHDSLLFKRLFAPAAPHTTAAKGRSCVSCHNNPEALGYGKGTLTYTIDEGKGFWKFNSHYKNNSHDGLPEDAWVGFLDDRKGQVVSTRTDVFPFSVDQQKAILTFGACLTCHDEKSAIMVQSVVNYDSLVKTISPKCILPLW
ncbi:MAG: hypothetical protein A2W85_16930 [Bacteroidetes bacterium GWF2_41_31]|nr:MAG: hypothetical protein A2W85_16930 [Bacteroidetes bacterium GWF2_41_31]